MTLRRLGLLLGVVVLIGLSAACKPQVSLKVSPERIQQGEEVLLTWTSKRAQTVSLNGEPVAKSGTKIERPQQTTAYEALAKRGKREARAFARVEVDIPVPSPTLSFSVEPDVIERGQRATLHWSATHAESVEISDIGPVSPRGSQEVSPEQSTTYTAIARGPGGEDTKSVRLTVNEPTPPTPSPTPTTHTRNVAEAFGEAVKVIYFDFDRSELKDEAQQRLRSAAAWLSRLENRSIRFRIEGHCCDCGTEEYNMGLGDRRAHAARDFLINLGVDSERIDMVSYGEEQPAAPGRDEPAHQLNRRAEFVYLEGGDREIPIE